MSDREVLPDSRSRDGRGAVQTGTVFGIMVPIYCASCGTDGGLVPEKSTTFIFWLCNPCFGKYGEIAGTMVQPDQEFWREVKQEMAEGFGRELNDRELSDVVTANATPLATLIIEKGRNQ